MIRNTIHCNDYNSDRSTLANMYVQVRILLGNTHALLQALEPKNKPSHLLTIPKHTVSVCTTWGSGCFILWFTQKSKRSFKLWCWCDETADWSLFKGTEAWPALKQEPKSQKVNVIYCAYYPRGFNGISLLHLVEKLNRKLWQKPKSLSGRIKHFPLALIYEGDFLPYPELNYSGFAGKFGLVR